MAKRVTLGRNLKSLFSDNRDAANGGIDAFIKPQAPPPTPAAALPLQMPAKRTQGPKIVWEAVLENIKRKSNPQVFFWFAPLKLVSQSEDAVVLKANSQFDRDWITSHYLDFISQTIEEVHGRRYEIKFTVEEEYSQDRGRILRAEEEDEGDEDTDDSSESLNGKPREGLFSGFLNPKYTFENFIVGSSNQFAHAACVAVAKKPGEHYNPIFIHGGVGLGKTHLISAVGNYILKKTSSIARVACISAESFTNQVINSIKSNKMEEFRNRYRFGCDVLLIDDIQFIAGKESTQEEFFHTFNTLYESKKQIIITSDKPPRDMTYLEERLKSRFEWGLITDIQPPEMETKVAILKKKAESEVVSIPNEVAMFIAQNVTSNIRELEGALVNIIGYGKLLKTDITVELAREALKNIVKEPGKKVLSIESIQREVSSFFGLRVQELKSERKQKNIAIPRQICMYLTRKYTGASFPEIGEKFGGKDHSTVIHAVKRVEGMIAMDSTLRSTIEAVSRKIEALRGSG
ncbi:MAG: chromosomal replication initiator protein DnaA [Deltaproteobacteria bacterium]